MRESSAFDELVSVSNYLAVNSSSVFVFQTFNEKGTVLLPKRTVQGLPARL
jgi:hypothetical protein